MSHASSENQHGVAGVIDLMPGPGFAAGFMEQIVPQTNSLIEGIRNAVKLGDIPKAEGERLLSQFHTVINSINITLLAGLTAETGKQLQDVMFEAANATAKAVREKAGRRHG